LRTYYYGIKLRIIVQYSANDDFNVNKFHFWNK